MVQLAVVCPKWGGMRALALRGSLLLEAATDVVGGGELVMVLRS